MVRGRQVVGVGQPGALMQARPCTHAPTHPHPLPPAGHLDFIWGYNARRLVYDKVVARLAGGGGGGGQPPPEARLAAAAL
jgi:hypothetical protein